MEIDHDVTCMCVLCLGSSHDNELRNIEESLRRYDEMNQEEIDEEEYQRLLKRCVELRESKP
jgi:hypothetical protein